MKKEKRGKGPHSRPGAPHRLDNGTWVQYITFEGKRYKRKGSSSQQVRDKITALRAELNDPERLKVLEQGPTLAELCEQLLANYDADGSTYRTYGYACVHWRRLLGDTTRKSQLTNTNVQSAVDELAKIMTPGTISTYYAAFHQALGTDHPALVGIKLPKDEDDDTEEESQILIPPNLIERLQVAAQFHPMGVAIGLGFGAGTRAGEVAALRWQDIDFTNYQISINGSMKPTRSGWMRGKTKNRKNRFVTVNIDLIDWLERHQRIQKDTANLAGYPPPQFVIADPTSGQGVNRTVPVAVLRQLLAEVCTPEELAQFGELRFHALRHNHVSRLLSQGGGLADIARRAGNKPETLLEYYAHPVPGADKHLAALAGELFPVPSPEATRQATKARRNAPQSQGTFNSAKEEFNRGNPLEAAGNPEEHTPQPLIIRSEPQESALISNPVSNLPTETGGGCL